MELIITVPTSPYQRKIIELQAESTMYQAEAKLTEQKVKELMEEGKKVTLEIDKLRVELALAQQSMQVDSGTACDHGDLQGKVRTLEQRLIDRAPSQAELQQDLEDTNVQLIVERKLVVEY